MANLIDTHFHLDHYRNYREIASRISELKQYTICVTNSPGVFLSCKNMLIESKYLKFAIGFHPLEEDLNEKELNRFYYLLSRTNYVGEIGLDYSKSARISKVNQLRYFESILDRCVSEKKLMTIHIRDAETQAIELLRKYAPLKCIIHWFTGTENNMAELLELGCYFSVNSNMVVSRSSSKYLRIPKNRILIESDGPYTKVLGKKYSPDLLRQSYQLISRFFGVKDIQNIVYSNFLTILES